MKRILIVGCGFGGLSCAKKLSRAGEKSEVVVIDRSSNFNFLPLLPDCIGRNIKTDFLTFPISFLSKKYGFNFVNSEVESVDLDKNIVFSGRKTLSYDYLVIASGSETNFYHNDSFRKHAYKLDDVEDAIKITKAIESNLFDSFFISGGGYTGIEIATNLRLNRRTKNKRIIIIEQAPSILGPLPDWIKIYVMGNLKKLGIEAFLNSTVKNIEKDEILLSDGKIFENSMLIWTAGVKTAGFIQNLSVDKNPQGRIRTDQYLRIKDNCFAVGDAANFIYKEKPLRMAAQFSIREGEFAASNILNSITRCCLKKFRPLDLGYIIPMANNRSCGNVFNINVKGFFATFCHYLMCIYRSISLKNKIGLAVSLMGKN